MSANPTQDNLSRASTEHLRAAQAALAGAARTGSKPSSKRPTASGSAPRSAAYLAHVATECAIKLRIISLHKRARTEEMRKVLTEEVFEQLFRSKHGHDLRLLSKHASLNRLLEAEGQTPLDDAAWKRMTSEKRPYDLRYGTAVTSQRDAEAEVDLASLIVITIQRGLTE